MSLLLDNALAQHPSSELNKSEPNMMHIDLNSCFATVEQQAHPHLRGKPIGVTNRITPHCCMIALSYEAKFMGAKVGMRYDEIIQLIPNLVVLETDPPKYHHAYESLLSILKSYSPNVTMKSIDEGVVDFRGTRGSVNNRPLSEIGAEIKQRLREDLGCWMKCNIGISTNRFLAKLASGFNKPDGLTVIDHENLVEKYQNLNLQDLPGIANRFEARLNKRGIITPIDFLNSPIETLHKNVFEGVVGVYWHQRIRGYEVDDIETKLGVVGKQFVLDIKTKDEIELTKRFSYLCYSTARKLRFNEVKAQGVYVYLQFRDKTSWYKRHLFKEPFNSDRSVFENAKIVFDQRPKDEIVTMMSITCYHLSDSKNPSIQLELFRDLEKEEHITETIDEINDAFGLPTVMLARALGAHDIVRQKIPFGSTKYFELLCKRA